MTISCRTLLAAAISICALHTAPALSQTNFPDRPLHIVVPTGPGGITDVLARTFAQKMTEAWGQPVVVDNKPGGGGVIASQELLKAPADGYTLTMGIPAHVINPMIMPHVPYELEKDLMPVTMLAKVYNVIAVHPSVPANNLAEFVALAKENPKRFSYGSSGIGQSTHLSGELLKSVAGFDMAHVPYNGPAQATRDAVAGHLPVVILTASLLAPQIKSGNLKAIAVTGTTRSPVLPDVPTVAESGYPSYDVSGVVGLMVRAGTPRMIVDKIAAEVARIVEMPDIRKRLIEAGADPVASTPEQYSEYLKAETVRWAPVVQKAGLKID